MMRANRLALVLAAGLTVGFTLGCMGGGEEAAVEEEPAVEVPDTPEGKAAYVAKAASAEKALEEVGMSQEELDTLLFDIAKDVERTDTFLAAMEADSP